MMQNSFNQILDKQIQLCTDMMIKKQDAYAEPKDALAQFRTASSLTKAPMRRALAGMMAKHTVSIFDMCSSDETYGVEVWEEKITDHINYLLLLKAVVIDERVEQMMQEPLPFKNN